MTEFKFLNELFL